MDDSQRLERRLYGLSLVAAPVLLAASSVFWEGRSVGLTGGVLVVYSFTCWIGVVLAFTSRLSPRMPRLALVAAPVAILACVAGTNFGVEGIVEGGLGIADLSDAMLADAEVPERAALVLAFFLPGGLFPLTLLLYAAALVRARSIPAWCGALIGLGAITFPLSRISRIQEIALISDALLVISLSWLGAQYLRNTTSRAETRV
jgi:hypothetical protein